MAQEVMVKMMIFLIALYSMPMAACCFSSDTQSLDGDVAIHADLGSLDRDVAIHADLGKRFVQVSVCRCAGEGVMRHWWSITGVRTITKQSFFEFLTALEINAEAVPFQRPELDNAMAQLSGERIEAFADKGAFTLQPQDGWLWCASTIEKISREPMMVRAVRLRVEDAPFSPFFVEGFPVNAANSLTKEELPFWLRESSV